MTTDWADEVNALIDGMRFQDTGWPDSRKRLAAALRKAKAAGRMEASVGLFEAIAHGDDIHRGWLKEAIDNWFAGRPVPPPRDAKTIRAAAEKLEAQTP